MTPSRVVLLTCLECHRTCTDPEQWSIIFLGREEPWRELHRTRPSLIPPRRWRVGAFHHACVDRENIHYEIPTPSGGHTENSLLHWAGHMMEKNWVAATAFSAFLMDAAKDTRKVYE